MKRLLLLSLVFVSLTASAFDVPKHYLPAIKPAFSAPFIKATNTITPTILPGSESFDFISLYTTYYGSCSCTEVSANMAFSQARSYRRTANFMINMSGQSNIGSTVWVPANINSYGLGLFAVYYGGLEASLISATVSLRPYVGD